MTFRTAAASAFLVVCSSLYGQERPFVPGDPLAKPSPIDLSFLNEKLAGEKGPIGLSKDGMSFVDGAGNPIRFWSAVTDLWQKSAEEIHAHCKFLARQGVNMARLHAQVPGGKGSAINDVDDKTIDGLRRWVSIAKKYGIYTTISPFWAHQHAAEKWGLPGYEKNEQHLYGLIFIEPKLEAAYKNWTKKLYADPNPYTGIPLAKDPSVAIAQVQNEDSLLFWTTGAIEPYYKAKLADLFSAWALKKYGSIAKLKAAYAGTSAAGDRPDEGKYGLLDHWMLAQDQEGNLKTRVDDQAWCYANLQRDLYTRLKTHYRSIGYNGLLNATNWTTADTTRLGDLERWSYAAMDVAAVNRYYDGGLHQGEGNGWRVDPGHKFSGGSSLKYPRDLPMNLRQPKGMPMIITESAWVWPNQTQSEGPLVSAAMMSVNGVDSFYWFIGSHTTYSDDFLFRFLNFPGGQHATQKWTGSTPQQQGMFPAAALLFRRGYLKEAAPVLVESRPPSALARRVKPILSEDKGYDPNRDAGVGSTQGQSSVDPMAFLVGPVIADFSEGSKTLRAPLSAFIDPAGTIKAGTGEVVTDTVNNRMVFDAPMAQGFAGTPGIKPIRTGDVTFLCKNNYANVALVSMDGLPLKSSKKILVQFGSTARTTGWEAKPARFAPEKGKPEIDGYEVVKTGDLPWLLGTADLTIVLNNPKLTKMTVIADSGAAARTEKLVANEGRTRFAFPKDALYVVLE